jgi:hypothetical protein
MKEQLTENIVSINVYIDTIQLNQLIESKRKLIRLRQPFDVTAWSRQITILGFSQLRQFSSNVSNISAEIHNL